MDASDFQYTLPDELIAQRPLASRRDSRLLVLGTTPGCLTDLGFVAFPDCLNPGDLLVFNDTRVIPARLFARKQTGGAVEILIERVIAPERAWAHIRASKAPRIGATLWVDDRPVLEVVGRDHGLYELRAGAGHTLESLLNEHGHTPLPPYIQRSDEPTDKARYQTVYARRAGAVAAPTAGLHFDSALLESLAGLGVETAFLTLHVGAGTFQPVRSGDIESHHMHAERVSVDADLVRRVHNTRAHGGRVVAVGTTVVRALESAAAGGQLDVFEGETRMFIVPGYQFQVVDALLTNFHLPESTLLMLVCAFGGYDAVMQAYRHAVSERYRFFSYGDAMFLNRAACPDLPPDRGV